MATLTNCPFCGALPQFSRIPGQGFSALCTGCGAIAIQDQNPTREALAAGWNRRTKRPDFSDQGAYKPCPFCSSKAGVNKLAGNNSILKCTNCGMIVSFAKSDDLATTLASWNQRIER